jgi:glycine/D-amino acid oxidase-like deaminating enzyme
MINGELSFWHHSMGLGAPQRQSVQGDLSVDVLIVGGGLSGLWTAYALATKAPHLSVAVIEAESVGYGASGRNGGWLSAKPVGTRSVLAKAAGSREAVVRTEAQLERALDQILEVFDSNNADIDAVRGGWMQIARTASEQKRIEKYLDYNRSWGVENERLTLLSAAEAEARVAVEGTTGALYSPDNVRIHPTKMVTALAGIVERMGVDIYEASSARDIMSGRVSVNGHTICARDIVVAVEGYASALPGQKRDVLPLNSTMIMTEPLSDSQWERIGWSGAEGISGAAHTYFYGQRTADGRIAIGGRGKPYRFNSALDANGEVDAGTVRALESMLRDIFPGLRVPTAHAWCGVLGVTRDWSPFIEHNREQRVVQIGGFAGQGLTATYLGGHAIAEMILPDTEQTTAEAWARSRPRKWEVEPLRWIGSNALYKVYALADVLERQSRSGKTSILALMADRVAGR